MAETVSVAFDSSSFKSTDRNFALAEHRKLAASVFVTLGSNPVCVNITEITGSNGTVGFNLPPAYVVNLQLATTNSLSTFTNVFKVTNFLHNTPFDVLVSLERFVTDFDNPNPNPNPPHHTHKTSLPALYFCPQTTFTGPFLAGAGITCGNNQLLLAYIGSGVSSVTAIVSKALSQFVLYDVEASVNAGPGGSLGLKVRETLTGLLFWEGSISLSDSSAPYLTTPATVQAAANNSPLAFPQAQPATQASFGCLRLTGSSAGVPTLIPTPKPPPTPTPKPPPTPKTPPSPPLVESISSESKSKPKSDPKGKSKAKASWKKFDYQT